MDLCKKIQYILHKKIYFSANYSLIHLGGMSEQQNNNYNKQKKLFANDIFFINRFYGNKKSFKALKFMMRAYMIRLFILRLAYRHADRTKQINKTQNSIKMLRELKKC